MARREVVEVTCDRCKRTDYQAPGDRPETGEGSTHEFQILLHDKKVEYVDLCKSCRKTLGNYFDKIIKAPKPDDQGSEKGESESTPSPPPARSGLFSRSKAAG